MFTGLIETTARVRRFLRGADRAQVGVGELAREAPIALGESIAVNGVCLTATRTLPDGFDADVSAETLAVTTLKGWRKGQSVNIERSLRLGDRMGGHAVLGHVDGVGEILAVEPVGARDGQEMRRVQIAAPAPLHRFIAQKGSIAVDGVSLTVNLLSGRTFEMMLVPHTLAVTALKDWRAGQWVNIEVDVLARYVARFIETGDTSSKDAELLNKLREGGFLP